MGIIVTPSLVFKYVDGNCSPDEVEAIHQWFNAIDAKDDPFKDLSANEEEALKMLMLNNFKSTVFFPHGQTEIISPKSRTRPLKILQALSAIAAMALLIAGIHWMAQRNLFLKHTTANRVSEQVVVNNMTNRFYRKVLSDSSSIWLSPRSKLEFPEKFSGRFRQVKLSGSAFFEIAKDHQHPFIIYSGGVITKVWGTSFRIHNSQDSSTVVSVVTGKVSVTLPRKEGSQVMLLPLQKVVHHANETSLTLEDERKNSEMRIWQKTSMTFSNITVDLLLKRLNDHFNVHIYTNKKELGSYIMKADFTNLNLAEILEMLEGSLNVAYQMNNTEIELYPTKYKV
jgi:transmembrane sensor